MNEDNVENGQSAAAYNAVIEPSPCVPGRSADITVATPSTPSSSKKRRIRAAQSRRRYWAEVHKDGDTSADEKIIPKSKRFRQVDTADGHAHDEADQKTTAVSREMTCSTCMEGVENCFCWQLFLQKVC